MTAKEKDMLLYYLNLSFSWVRADGGFVYWTGVYHSLLRMFDD